MAVTTQMRTQVTQLYVSLFGRAPEASGLGYWVSQLSAGKSFQTVAQDMFNVDASRATYPTYLTNEEIVAKFYVNVLGRTADAGGLAYWTGRLNTESTTGTAASKMIAVGTVITEMLTAVVAYSGTDAAGLQSQSLFNNKVAVGLHYAVDLGGDNIPFASTLMPMVSSGPTGANAALAAIDSTLASSLTNGIDNLTANVFTSVPVYTPGGNDFINSLQDEDSLTGVGVNPTLNATLGSVNDAAESVIVPKMSGVQTANFEITGNAGGINFQDSTGLTNLNINRITQTNATVTMTDLDKSTTALSVSNATRDGTVNFLYKEDNLLGTSDEVTLNLANARLKSLNIDETGDSGEDQGYGFETVNVNVNQASNIDEMIIGANTREDVSAANSSQTINIVAKATTEINQLTALGAETINLTANADVLIAADERNTLQSSNDGISTTDLTKLTITGTGNVTIDGLEGNIDEESTVNGEEGTTLVVDASAMTGALKLGVAVAADGNSSGIWDFHTDKDVSITSGSGNDIIETYTALAGDITTGAGNDQVLVNDGGDTPTWTDVEGVSTINTGTGNDTVRAKDLLATANDVTAGNTSFGQVTAASIVTGEGDDTVTVAALASNKDWNNGVLTDSNLDDTYFVKGASISTGVGADTITVTTLAEGAMVDAGADNDTLKININGGTILAGDDTAKNTAPTPAFTEVNLDGSVNVFGAIVEMGDGDDTVTVADASSLTTAATTIVGTDAELRAGAGNDVLNVTALDAVSVVSATSYTSATNNDINTNVTGVETANFTVANQIDAATATATVSSANDNDETDGSITADIMRFDNALAAINLVSQEKTMLQGAATEIYEAGQATSFTLNNFRDGIALTLKANEATGVSGAGALKDDEVVDVNLTVNNASARGHAETFTLNIAEGSEAFDLNLNLNATATDTVGNAASKTDDDDKRVEHATINLAADDKGHYIDFNGFGDANHSDAFSEGSRVVNTSLTVTGGNAGTNLVLDRVSADKIEATGAANVKLKVTASNNYVINTGSGNDVINMVADDVRANDLTDDGDTDSVDTIDEADAINAGSGNDRVIINGNDSLGIFSALGGLTDDDVFGKIKSVESIEVQGGGANTIIIDEAAATSGTNLQNIYFTGVGAQTTTVQIGNNFVNNNGTVANTLTLDSTMSLLGDKGAAAKSGPLTLTIDNQDTDQDTDLINLNVIVGMEKGTDVNFYNTGDSKATVNISAVVAANSPNTVGKSIGAADGNLSLEVTTGSIDKVTLLDSADAADTNDNGQITVTVDNSWSKSTLEFDASAIMNDDEAGYDLAVEEIEGSGDPAVTQVAGIQAGDTGGLVFNGVGELDAKLIVRGTQNDDNITGSSQNDTLEGNDGDDIIVGGLGHDSITGGAGNDDLTGGIGKDTISGGDGDDVIYAGLGGDVLSGGAGADKFIYNSNTESYESTDQFDTISDFETGKDKILVNGVIAGDGGQNFINLASFSTVDNTGDGDNSLAGDSLASQLVLGDAFYSTSTGKLVIDVNGNGDITTGVDVVIQSTGPIKASDINYTIDAGAGNDFIRGGQGSDDLNGGAGNDTFVLLGTLSEAEAAAYAAAYQAGGNTAAAVLGATLAGVENKVLSSSTLFASRSETEVNTGDKINSAGTDAGDTIHAFGTADLSKINDGLALNVGTLVVHSSITLTYAQVNALNAVVFDGNMPHAVTLKSDTTTALDTVAKVLSKLFFVGAGTATTFTITAQPQDGVLTAAWDPVDGRMEVVSNTSTSIVAAAGTPIQGLGGATNLSDKTYASAVIQYNMGLTGYEIVDTASAIAAGTDVVLDAATSVAVNNTTVDASLLNAIDGSTQNLLNATSVTTLTGTVTNINNALDDQGTIDTAANVAVTITSAADADAGLLNAINANTTGLVNATAPAFIVGSDIDVLNAIDSPSEMTYGPAAIMEVTSAQATAANLNAIDALVSTTVDANSVSMITGTSADVWNAMDNSSTMAVNGGVWVKLSGLVQAADVISINGATVGAIEATTASGTTGFTGTAANLAVALPNVDFKDANAAVTVTGTTAQAADLIVIEGQTTATVNAAAVLTINGTATEVLGAIDNPADTLTATNVAINLVNDGNGIAATLNSIDAATTGLVNATAYTTITGTVSAVLDAVNDQAQMVTAANVALTLAAGTATAADLITLDDATTGLVNALAITAISGTAAELVEATDEQGNLSTHAFVAITVAAGAAAAADLIAINGVTNTIVNATAVTEITGSVADVITATGVQAELDTDGAVLVTLAAGAGVAATDLNTINGVTTGLVNATAITSITGLAADVLNAVDSQSEMSTAANVAVTVSAGVATAADLNAIDAATTGLVNATAVTTVEGSIAAVTDALNDQAAMSTAAAVLVTLDDTAATATAMNTLDALTSGAIDATTVGTVTGAIADLITAFGGGFTNLTADATVTGTSTIAQLNTLNGSTADVITFGTAFATTTPDVIDLNSGDFDAAAHTIKYTAGNQTVTFNFTDDDAGNTLNDNDYFTPAGSADVIDFGVLDILDLTAFNLGSLASANVLYVADNQKVGDNEWTMVQGNWNGTVFTVAAAGADTLVLWDSNAGASVTQSAVVITGVPSLAQGTTILV